MGSMRSDDTMSPLKQANVPLTKEGVDIARGIMLCLTGREDAQTLIGHAESLKASGPLSNSEVDELKEELAALIKCAQQGRIRSQYALLYESKFGLTLS
mgnify:CR=1 FL=1